MSNLKELWLIVVVTVVVAAAVLVGAVGGFDPDQVEQVTSSPVIAPPKCVDEDGLSYSSGARVRTEEGVKRCMEDGTWKVVEPMNVD